MLPPPSPRALFASLLLFLVPCGRAFNVLPEGALVLWPSTPGLNSYFGYSVQVARDDVDAWVMVGAPRAKVAYSKWERPGMIYKCRASMDFRCTGTDITSTDLPEDRYFGLPSWNDSFVGASIDLHDSGQGGVVCAPKSTIYDSYDKFDLHIHGVCSWEGKHSIYIRPFVIKGKQYSGTSSTESNSLYTSGEAGLSVHILQDNPDSRDLQNVSVLIGAPGYMRWSGTVLFYKIQTLVPDDIPELINPNHELRNGNIEPYSYWGYSVSSGNFGFTNSLQYVAGAPRASNLVGKVVIFNANDNEYNIIKEINGTQMGEYFGSSLCVADLNNDGIDDLIVGAPQHKVENADEGCVYVYASDTFPLEPMSDGPTFVGTKKYGARYGTSIALIGDINKDGYPDVAIGAPYEDNNGAIYIYHGSKIRPFLYLSQHIKASTLMPTLKGFGFSISRGLDLDNNSYDDFAVGSYLSNETVVLRSSPVLRIQSRIKNEVSDKIVPSSQNHKMSICHKFEDSYIADNIDISVLVKIDPLFSRASLTNGKNFHIYNITLRNGTEACQNFYLLLQNHSVIYKPLEIFVYFTILSPKTQRPEFCKNCPVLDPQSENATLLVYYETLCEGYECKVDVSVQANLTPNVTTFTVGETDTLKLQLQIKNEMEPSYETNVTITIPTFIHLRQQDRSCQKEIIHAENITTLICTVPHILQKDTKPFELSILLDVGKIPWEIKYLTIGIQASGAGEEQNSDDNELQFDLPLQRNASLSLKGTSVPDQIFYSAKEIENDGVIFYDRLFQHIYQITNSGPTPIDDLKITFFIPFKNSIMPDNESLFLYNSSFYQQDITCRSILPKDDFNAYGLISALNTIENSILPKNYLHMGCKSEDIQCHVIECSVNKLIGIKDKIIVSFQMNALLKDYGHLIDDGAILFETYGILESNHIKSIDSHSICSETTQTILLGQLPASKVQPWIIIVGIIIGIILLIVLVFILWKLGFFKRKKVSELKESEELNKDEGSPLCADPK